MKQTESVFWTTWNNFWFPYHQRLKLGTKLEYKDKWCCYSSNKHQDTLKQKGKTESNDNMGCLPRALSL